MERFIKVHGLGDPMNQMEWWNEPQFSLFVPIPTHHLQPRPSWIMGSPSEFGLNYSKSNPLLQSKCHEDLKLRETLVSGMTLEIPKDKREGSQMPSSDPLTQTDKCTLPQLKVLNNNKISFDSQKSFQPWNNVTYPRGVCPTQGSYCFIKKLLFHSPFF